MLPRPQKLWRKHFPSGCWCPRSTRRAEILYRAAQTLQERKENLAQDMTREMGKVLLEVRGDMQEGIDMAYYMAGEGRRLPDGDRACEFFIEPTVFAGVAPQMRIAQEEIFGPVVSVIPRDGLESAIEIGNGISCGLSSAIYTQDVNKAFAAVRDMYTGIFYVNSSTVGAEIHLPFGGTNRTGNRHREAGVATLDTFSEWKSVYVDYSGKLQRAQVDTGLIHN